MHAILTIVALIAAGSFFLWRFKGGANGADAASETSSLGSIENPILGAAVMIAAIANVREPIDAATATVIGEEIRETTGVEAHDIVDFAVRAVARAPDPDNISLRLSLMWNQKLDLRERQQLVDMALRVATIKGSPTDMQMNAIERLKARLDLV